jgi:hypothetical protein
MLMVQATLSELVDYVSVWNNEFSLNLTFRGQYGKDAAWTVGNVIITGIEIAPSRVLCEFANFDLQGADKAARRVIQLL